MLFLLKYPRGKFCVMADFRLEVQSAASASLYHFRFGKPCFL